MLTRVISRARDRSSAALRSTAFLFLGVALVVLPWVGYTRRVFEGWSNPMEFIYAKLGIVSIPLALAALVLLWITIQNAKYRMKGCQLSDRQVQALLKLASITPQLGLQGTVIGMITALTGQYAGMSELEAQTAKMNAFGTALHSTLVGVVLSLGAELQIPNLEEDNRG